MRDVRPAGVDESFATDRPGPSPVAIVIEPEPQLRRVVRAYLIARGYRCLDAEALPHGLLLALSGEPAAVVLDVAAPGAEPSEVVARVHAETHARILLLGDHDELRELARCLDAGADDFLTKPFTANALDQRLGSVSRAAPQLPTAIRFGPLWVDLERRSVRIGSRDIPLSEVEHQLLALLLRHTGRVLTIRQIAATLWGEATDARGGEVRDLMRALREKLEDDRARPKLLRTETGIGYRVLAGEAESA